MSKQNKWSFTLVYPKKNNWPKDYGLNAYYTGKHWAQRKADADYWHWLVCSELRSQAVPKRHDMERPVKITFYHNSNMDIDNHAVMEKMIVDGLKGHLLPDDRRKYYVEKVSRFHDENYMLIVVEAIGSEEPT